MHGTIFTEQTPKLSFNSCVPYKVEDFILTSTLTNRQSS